MHMTSSNLYAKCSYFDHAIVWRRHRDLDARVLVERRIVIVCRQADLYLEQGTNTYNHMARWR